MKKVMAKKPGLHFNIMLPKICPHVLFDFYKKKYEPNLKDHFNFEQLMACFRKNRGVLSK